MAGGVDAAQIRKASKIEAFQVDAVGDQQRRAGVLQLVADFTLAIARVKQRGSSSRKRGGVKCGAELPAVGQIDPDYFARLEASGDQPSGERSDKFAILGVGNTAIAR